MPDERAAKETPMKLTHASTYALHALAYLAAQKSPEKPVPSQKIASAADIESFRFLLKVLQPLVEKGVLYSIKGPNGGYRLARPPADISMLEILEAVDGAIRGVVPPPTNKRTRTRARDVNAVLDRRLEVICSDTAEVVKKQLDQVKLADLIAPRK